MVKHLRILLQLAILNIAQLGVGLLVQFTLEEEDLLRVLEGQLLLLPHAI